MKTHLIPLPWKLEERGGYFAGHFIPTERTCVFFAPCFRDQAALFAGYLRASTGLPFPLEEVSGPEAGTPHEAFGSERLEGGHFCLHAAPSLEREEYRILVEPFGALLEASSPEGMAHAVHSALQLFPPAIFSPSPRIGIAWTMATARIHDRPACAWRGFMLDCARHFIPVPELRRFIDVLALHRYNVLQLHLTDDQGWRIEIKACPRLTEAGAFRAGTRLGHKSSAGGFSEVPHGGFYTQDELRDLVAYARIRGISIVPEIDLPGHVTAVLAAYPEFGAEGPAPAGPTGDFGIFPEVLFPSRETMQFVRTVLREVAELFPAPFLHIGGDEVIPDRWRTDSRMPGLLRELGLGGVDELQPWFTRQLHAIAAELGKRIIGWDEILHPELPGDAIIHCWRGASHLSADRGRRQTIVAPSSHVYFDFYQSEDISSEPLAIGGCTPLEKVYGFDAATHGFSSGNILGVQAQLWTEYMPDEARRQYMAFPRACALAEVAWSPGSARNWTDFKERLRVHLKRLEVLGVRYRPVAPSEW